MIAKRVQARRRVELYGTCDERPGDEVLEKIEERLVSAIGLEAHQRMSAVHIDTDYLHMHIAINKIHPTTFRMHEPYFDQRKLMAECERLEKEFGLVRTNHGRSTDPQPIEVTRAFRAELQKSGVGIAMLDGAADWREVHRRLEAKKLVLKHGIQEMTMDPDRRAGSGAIGAA
jgi:hypothetical protein